MVKFLIWKAGEVEASGVRMTACYSTKRVISYFSRALYKETKHTNIKVGTFGPGMVATDLLVRSWKNGDVSHWRKKKRLFLFIIDPAEIVADYLVRKMLVNNKTNTRILWMTPFHLIFRFFQPYYWRRNPIAGTALEKLDIK